MSTSSRLVVVSPLSPDSLTAAKFGFSTRRVPQWAMRTLISGPVRPRSGDLVLAKIHRLGQHRKLELPSGRRATLHLDDLVIVAYADRYAPDQFESHVPADLKRAQLVASGGIASQMLSRSADVRNATDIDPIGLVGDERGRPINISDFGLPAPLPTPRSRTVGVIGTSMNSGKTTTVHYLVHTLSKLGLKASATKVTGTGSGGDYWVMLDAGAHRMFDFTDVGLASTYRMPMATVEQKFTELIGHAAGTGADITFVEVADGIYQRETSKLLDSGAFRNQIDAVIFAAADAMGAVAGVNHLTSLGHEVLAISGRLTRSPLAAREAAEITGLPVLGLPELCDPVVVQRLVGVAAPALDYAAPMETRLDLGQLADGPYASQDSELVVDDTQDASDLTIILREDVDA